MDMPLGVGRIEVLSGLTGRDVEEALANAETGREK
jgi:hypothetical protein